MESDREYILEEEWFMVRHSGEIPEVALHASLYYLREEKEGPKLVLTREEEAHLQQAALTRYEEIIFRDLDPSNRDLPLFRGIRRANHNWYRYVRFCERIHSTRGNVLRTQVSQALIGYLVLELAEVRAGARTPSVNCTVEALETFAITLGLDGVSLPQGWETLCESPLL